MVSEAAPALRIGVLGPLELRVAGEPVPVSVPRERALLSLLVCRAGQTMSTEELIEGLWGQDPPRTALGTLRNYVSGLRKLLPAAVLTTEPAGYRLALEPGAVDADRFEDLLRAARVDRDPGQAVTVLGEALSVWRGEAFGGATGSPVLGAAAGRLEELRRAAVEDLGDLRLALGEHSAAVPDLAAAAAAEPLRERRWSQLMLALYRDGRQAEALSAFRRLSVLLGDELGLEPSVGLGALHQAILSQDPALEWSGDGQQRRDGHGVAGGELPGVAGLPRHNLPFPVTSFVGRGHELDLVRQLLGTSRLVTCVGPGGVGKTRLALHVADGLIDRPGRGVWLVELAAVTDANLVPGAVAAVLGLRDEPGRPALEQLVHVLRSDDVLILLDNCEHLLDACARLADVLLRQCGQVRLLATSREPLGVDGESVVRVAPLLLPGAEVDVGPADLHAYEAVELFAERVRAHHPDLVLDEAGVQAMVSICRRLDGIPLALEMAAGRLGSLTLIDVERRLTDRFRLLTGGSRAAMPRQRTLRALIDWSFDLLTEPERRVLGWLGVFAGSFDLDAVGALAEAWAEPGRAARVDAADIADIVISLAGKSLVQVSAADGRARFTLMETVREYALEQAARAGDLAMARDAHAEAYARLAELADSQLRGEGQVQWLRRLHLDRDNDRAAIGHLRAGRPLRALAMAAALGRFWLVSASYREGIDQLEAVLDPPLAPSPTLLRSKALTAAARLLRLWGEYGRARDRAEEALRIAYLHDDAAHAAAALTVLSTLHITLGGFAEGVAAGNRAVGLAETVGEGAVLVDALCARGLATSYASDPALGLPDLVRALALSGADGDDLQRATTLNNLACTRLDLGDLAAAEAYAREAHALSVDLDAAHNLPYVLSTRAALCLLRDDAAEADGYVRETLAMLVRTGDRRTIANCVLLLALCESGLRSPDRAAMLHGMADACLLPGAAYDPVEDGLRQRDHARLRRTLSDPAFEAAYTHGRGASSIDDVLDQLSQEAAGRQKLQPTTSVRLDTNQELPFHQDAWPTTR